MTTILIGYMGAGKTTLGKALAKRMQCPFADLDWMIEEQTHLTIPQIFAQQGEEGFRRIEQQTLHQALQEPQAVLAVGGGTPCFFDNIEFMNSHATTIYLKAAPTTLRKHIRMGGSVRPLVDGKNDEELLQFIEQSLRQREPFYLKANHHIDIQPIDTEQQIADYAERLYEIVTRSQQHA